MRTKSKQAAVGFSKERYSFVWTFHVACNYRCPYCWFDGQWKKLERKNCLRSIEETAAAWQRVYETYGECLLLLAGGEPTIYPFFHELIVLLGSRHLWHFNTNLSWGLERWRAFAETVDPTRGEIGCSYHPSQKVALADFAAKACLLRDAGFQAEVCFVAYPGQWDQIEACFGEFKRRGLRVRIQPYVGSFAGAHYPFAYDAAQKEMMRRLNLEMRSTLRSELDYAVGDVDPAGSLCRSGQIYAFIDQAGDVYRCTQVPTDAVNKLGNLYDGFELRGAPAACPLRFCRAGESRFLIRSGRRGPMAG